MSCEQCTQILDRKRMNSRAKLIFFAANSRNNNRHEHIYIRSIHCFLYTGVYIYTCRLFWASGIQLVLPARQTQPVGFERWASAKIEYDIDECQGEVFGYCSGERNEPSLIPSLLWTMCTCLSGWNRVLVCSVFRFRERSSGDEVRKRGGTG